MRRALSAHGQANVEIWGAESRALLWQKLIPAMHRTVHNVELDKSSPTRNITVRYHTPVLAGYTNDLLSSISWRQVTAHL